MATNESEFIHELKESFEDSHSISVWRKLHGDRFQVGLPDVLAAIVDVAVLAEVKWITKDAHAEMPINQCTLERLTALQRQSLMMLGAIDGPLRPRVVLGFPFDSDELPFGKGELAVGFDFGDISKYGQVSLVDVAGICLHARATGEWSPMPDGLMYQLRARGEKWRASPIVLGLKRYAVRTKIDMDVEYE